MGKIATTAALFAIVLIVLVGGAAIAVVHAIFGTNGSQPSTAALGDIPTDYLALYREAADVCPGLDWSILAAIGKIESNHGRSTLVGVADGTENDAGAGGPMQFLQSTWNGVLAEHTIPPGGSNPPSRYNPHDAIHAAAYLLCDNGARDNRDLRGAIWDYNHADWYVNDVLTQAQRYAEPTTIGTGNCNTIQATNPIAMTAIKYACNQQGEPYMWGGNGPDNGDAGFDCSGLTAAAFAAAGVSLPRTAHTQYHATARVTEAELQPGDLVFYGNPNIKIHHVGLYLGNGKMIDAPTFGKPIDIHPIRTGTNDDFAGGGRLITRP